jgi:hypothetical protein
VLGLAVVVQKAIPLGAELLHERQQRLEVSRRRASRIKSHIPARSRSRPFLGVEASWSE